MVSDTTAAGRPEKRSVVIVGGGTAGITVAAQLTSGRRKLHDVVIIDPSESHYYQPAWTLVAGGSFKRESTRRDQSSVIPSGATWLKDAVTKFDPPQCSVRTRDGRTIEYEFLVVCAGIRIQWEGIAGLSGNVGRNGICSNYSYETVASTWEILQAFQGGTAIFTQPGGSIKCGGAPQKICYLAEDYFRKQGIRDNTRVIFATPSPEIFPIEKYRPVLERVVERKRIETMFRHELVEIRPQQKEAVFRNVETDDLVVLRYDMIHVTPPMEPPRFIAESPLADEDGWVDVDPQTLQHKVFSNVFGLGDSSNLPTAKTGAAIRKQAPVLVKNLLALRAGETLDAKYDGYTSCPIVTGYGRVMLAEFDYNKQPAETFPINQAKERRSMWWLKKYALPLLYWHGMLKGRA